MSAVGNPMFLQAGLPWPAIKAEVPVGGEPGSFIYRWLAETLRCLSCVSKSLASTALANFDLDTLVARVETQTIAVQTQLIGRFSLELGLRSPSLCFDGRRRSSDFINRQLFSALCYKAAALREPAQLSRLETQIGYGTCHTRGLFLRRIAARVGENSRS